MISTVEQLQVAMTNTFRGMREWIVGMINSDRNYIRDLRARVSFLEQWRTTVDQILAKVTAQTTVISSAVTLLQELNTELKAAIASQDPAKIQAVSDAIDANTKALADAVAANTPAATPTP